MSIRDCPYVGLQPYTEEEREFFFGREKEQRVICSNLYAAALTVLYGASGVGKSSVLRAGVMPRVTAAPATIALYFNAWQDASFDRLFKQALLAEAAARYGAADGLDASLPLDEILARLARAHDVSCVLVLDQFEEYFLYHPASDGGSRFEAELAASVNREECRAGILISLRDDWLSRLDRFSGRIPSLLANTLRLDHLGERAAADAIREPLRVHRERYPGQPGPRHVDEDLVAEILRQVRAGEVALAESGGVGQAKRRGETRLIETAFLQLVLTRLWDAEKAAGSTHLRLATLEGLQGARQIVRAHLDGVMGELTPEQQQGCAGMFQYLVTPGGAKIAHETADLVAYSGRPAEQIAPVLEHLNRRRVLRRISPPERYEIFHDVLAPAILEWRARYAQAVEQAVLERRAAEQSRAARRFRRLSMVLAGLVLAVIALSVALGVWSRRLALSERQAREALTAAERSAGEARVSLDKANRAAGAEAAAKGKAELEARQALAHELAGAALNTLGTQTGIRFALGAVETTRSVDGAVLPDALDALRRAVPPVPLPLARPGHADDIQAMRLSPDGRYLATRSRGELHLWDAASGEQLWWTNLRGEGDLQFSRDGTRLACLDPFTVSLLDTQSGNSLASLSRATVTGSRGTAPERMVMDEAGRRIAVGSELKPLGSLRPGQWLLFSIPDGKPLTRVNFAEGPAGFSPGGNRFAAVSEGRVAVWDPQADAPLAAFPAKGPVHAIVFSDDGNLIAAAMGQSLTAWDVRTKGELRTFSAPSEIVTGSRLRFSPDGKLLAAAQGRTLFWGDLASGKASIQPLPDPASSGCDLRFGGGGRVLIAACNGGRVCRWDVASGRDLGCLSRTGFTEATLSTAGDRVAVRDGWLTTVLETATDQPVVQFRLMQEKRLASAGFSGDVRRLVTGSELSARIWDVGSGRTLFNLKGHSSGIGAVAFSPDGTLVATGALDGRAKIWEAASGRERHTLAGHRERILGLAFRPDGKVLATAGYDRAVKFWDTALGREIPLSAPIQPPGAVFSVAFGADGKSIATGTVQVQLWSAAGRAQRGPNPGILGIVQGLAFAARDTLVAMIQSGTFAAGPSQDWRRLPGSGGGPSPPINLGAALTRDRRGLAGGGEGNTLRIWDVPSGQEAAILYGHSAPVVTAAYSPDERYVYAVDADWNIYRHPLRITDLISEARNKAGRTLSAEECQTYLHRPCPAALAASR